MRMAGHRANAAECSRMVREEKAGAGESFIFPLADCPTENRLVAYFGHVKEDFKKKNKNYILKWDLIHSPLAPESSSLAIRTSSTTARQRQT